jgi:hypothetical protein
MRRKVFGTLSFLTVCIFADWGRMLGFRCLHVEVQKQGKEIWPLWSWKLQLSAADCWKLFMTWLPLAFVPGQAYIQSWSPRKGQYRHWHQGRLFVMVRFIAVSIHDSRVPHQEYNDGDDHVINPWAFSSSNTPLDL